MSKKLIGLDPDQVPSCGDLGSAAFMDASLIPRNLFTEVITADKTLTANDYGKVFVISGNDIDITLPASSSLPPGWMVTLHNDNSTNGATAHASASANTPFGQKVARIVRQGSDTLMGQSTQLHGAATLLGARTTMDVWLSASGAFGCTSSDRIGWKDLVSDPVPHGTTTKDPAETAIGGSFYRALEFDNAVLANEKEVYVAFHINHDYMMGTRVYPHVHWTPGNVTDNTKAVRWGFQYAVAKGHQQQAWSTTGTTAYVTQSATSTAYMHQVAELSDADAIPATSLEPDSVILMRIFRNSSDAADTLTGSAWVVTVDCHYLADRHATPNKAPGFYV